MAWRSSDTKAQKSGERSSIHWVKKKQLSFEEKVADKLVQYETSCVYQGYEDVY